MINNNFRMEVISMTNYIWKIYSDKYNLVEAIVDGSSDTLDKLSEGPTLEEEVIQYEEIIHVLKLLESMGNELKDELKELPPGLEEGLKRKRSRGSRRKKTKKKPRKKTTSSIISKELGSMKFMIGSKVISF